ncbi:hypothetical protein CCP4SC76_7560004 [Gammaproteobacteria bacterium]
MTYGSTLLRLTLSNGAVVTVLGANTFKYDVGGNALEGINHTPVSFDTFIQGTLGVTVPTSGIATGGPVTINGGKTYFLSVSKSGTGSGTVTSSPAGINCGSTCSASFASATSVTLTASPSSGNTFAGWSGDCSGVGVCTVSMTATKNVTATFTAGATSFGITVNKSGNGTVTSSPTGINCGSTCSASFASGTSLTLTASPASGYTFAGWSGDCSGVSACTVSMTATKNVTATFTAVTFMLSVSKIGSGTVTSSPTGINCGSTCSANLASGASMTLTATPATGSTFAGWSGACTNSSGTCALTMDATKNVMATFTDTLNNLSSTNSATAKPVAGTLIQQITTLNAGPPAYDSSWVAVKRMSGSNHFPLAFHCGQSGVDPLAGPYLSSDTYLDNDDEVTYNNCDSAFYRFTFTLPAGSTPKCLKGNINVDDQGVVFLNGHRISGVMNKPCNPTTDSASDPCYAQQDAGHDLKDSSGLSILTWPTMDAFETCNASYFKTGLNELVFGIEGNASYYSPTGLEFNAQVTGTPIPNYALAVAKFGTGSGTVTSNPSGISCGNDCGENFSSGTGVTLTATPASGSTFAGWSGDCSGASAPVR